MKKRTLALLFLASMLPMTGAVQKTITPTTTCATVLTLLAQPKHDASGIVTDIQEQKQSLKELRAVRILRLAHARTLQEEEKNQKHLIVELNDDSVWKVMRPDAISTSVLMLLSCYLQLGIATPLATIPKTTKYSEQRALVLRALKALGYSQKTIQELWEQGNGFWNTKIPDITELNELQALTYPQEWNDDAVSYSDALKKYKNKIDLLHADWLKTAQPLLILYATLYHQRSAAAKAALPAPGKVTKPLY